MLVLSRKVDERIVVGDNIVITVKQIAGNRVALGFEAPGHVRILRGELRSFAEELPKKEPLAPQVATTAPAPVFCYHV